MSPLNLLSIAALALALAGCGDKAAAPAVVAEEDFEALPAPAQPDRGGVTGMPDAPGPGAVPLAGQAAQLDDDATGPGATLFSDGMALPALPDSEATATLSPLRAAAPDQQQLPRFADTGTGPGTLPPLEDNPEAGLASGPHAAPPALPASASASAAPPGASARDATTAVRAYYDAIGSGDYNRAYAAWSDGGRSSGRTPAQFAAAFQDTRIIRVSIGDPGRVEGAAGSRFVEVPVTVTSRLADGRELRQAGSFAMRSSVVEGAAPGWHIVSADLRELQP
ncbi:hypothetical protein WCE39_02195 [Luteimonas sp. MJ174]|uniref:hypothetical protein n=1 Tax=Luteimonas sp. MJ174 TaxID=3129237 RepID=UPI0031BA2842